MRDRRTPVTVFLKPSEGWAVVWSSTRILWDQQVMLMWLLLPPIFIVCVGMALAAPWLARKPKTQHPGEPNATPKHVLVDTAR
jgi:hypothetical protein